MDLEFYVRVRTCEKRVTRKQPLDLPQVTRLLYAEKKEHFKGFLTFKPSIYNVFKQKGI